MLVKKQIEKLVSPVKYSTLIAFQPSLLYVHEKEMLKRESLCEKCWRRKLEGNLVPCLVAGKIVSIVIIIADKFDEAES